MMSQSIYNVISRESIFLIIKDTGHFVKVGLISFKILNKATLQYTFIVHPAAQKFSGQHNVQSTFLKLKCHFEMDFHKVQIL